MPSVTLDQILKEKKDALKLKLLAGRPHVGRKVTVAEINRPGLALGGYFKHFRAERIQVIGRGEHSFCSDTPPGVLLPILRQMLQYPNVPCLIVTRDLKAPSVLLKACREADVPLLQTALDTADFTGELAAYLEDKLAPMTTVHGVLVDVYGLGVLIQGESGIGKSECALELLKRGHIFISDDMVEIRQKPGEILTGSSPDVLKSYLEVRGLGILDVGMLFGIGAILDKSRIELLVQLEMWEGRKAYDRTGLTDLKTRILDVELPLIRLPVSPGRNLAVLIEVAALNQRLKSRGVSAAGFFNSRLLAKIKSRSSSPHAEKKTSR